MLILFLVLFQMPIFGQETLTSNVETSQEYRPGLNFQTTPLNKQNSLANLIDSASISMEYTEVGRSGAMRLDGAQPIMGIDGFVVKDPSICKGQINLHLLPYDFANRVDLYKQNLVPFGINAGSFVDFRIPITFSKYTSIFLKASTTASIYTKIQGEQPFKDGSTFWGVVADFGVKDYYYATDDGFEIYPYSTYDRTSVISKTVWKGWEFLVSHNYMDSYSEAGDESYPIMNITRNNLISGARYNKDIFIFSANYNFYNQYVKANSYTNDYLNHHVNIQSGVKDKIGRYYYQALLGYEYNNTDDGSRSTQDNYLGVPEYGEHFINIITEFGVSLFEEKENKPYNIDFNLSLNQIIATTGTYTPVPNLSIGFRHQNGWYSSVYASRVYLLPDISAAYGFGAIAPVIGKTVLPKDGFKTGVEFGLNRNLHRFYGNFSYSWLDKSFRLAEDGLSITNAEQVIAMSSEIGTESKFIKGDNVFTTHTAVAWNYEIDDRGISPSTIPMWKWIVTLSASNIDDTWNTTLKYRLTTYVPDTYGSIDKTVRHYLDLHTKYKIFVFNILNLANQSYRPIPNNIYSPYNPGIRAEFGIEYKFE